MEQPLGDIFIGIVFFGLIAYCAVAVLKEYRITQSYKAKITLENLKGSPVCREDFVACFKCCYVGLEGYYEVTWYWPNNSDFKINLECPSCGNNGRIYRIENMGKIFDKNPEWT